ncbi:MULTISPECIES: hypothetical protein [unclassified Chelatococcus]|uniref:thiolase C-terminal domain-containing protein n=1 Tax=unclassified Chelatococcus TaxID=2638111 RepID=UPI001BCA91FC|nr:MULTISPECIES: hypothetical protein [unclassified Chelatococcus]CAH1655230.1 conserved hypothetical protein [Hyphomicrobiales bacterium]MBS7742640.1 hypothetical protein [Chelatococcus sp. HY11]MBX3542242.1 hypothetical protein [Chelatococcus sp.]MCO5075542.1 hypothetical protein [Chelatococcus sp.]CAH1695381.1 conserved hypothetical protein [Hyphomicrobiales bacterium]
MAEGGDIFIEGVAMEISWADARRSLPELIFSSTTRAIDDAGRGWEGIESVVLAAHDLVDGRSLSSMVTAPAAGAYLRDEVRYGDDGAGAFAAAVNRLEAGECERTIVSAWGRASEHDVEGVSRALFDPVFFRPLGIEELHVSAMNAQRWLIDGGDVASVAEANQRREMMRRANPRALKEGGRQSVPSYPLEASHLPRWADVTVTMVLSRRPASVRLRGIGLSSEPYWPGDRRLARADALRMAAQRALSEAQMTVDQIDLFEVDGLTIFDEGIALEAIGLAEKGGGLRRLADDPRCNPSGGGASGYCAPAMGLIRLAEATLQLQGRAGGNQQGTPRVAFASGSSIIAGQTQTAVIVEAV